MWIVKWHPRNGKARFLFGVIAHHLFCCICSCPLKPDRETGSLWLRTSGKCGAIPTDCEHRDRLWVESELSVAKTPRTLGRVPLLWMEDAELRSAFDSTNFWRKGSESRKPRAPDLLRGIF